MHHIDFTRLPFDGPFHFQELEQLAMREHDHAFYEIAVVIGGRGWHGSGGQMLPVQECDVFIIPVGTPHCWLHDCHLQLLNIYYKAASVLPFIEPADPLRSVFFAGDLRDRNPSSAIHLHISLETLKEVRRELHQFEQGEVHSSVFRIGCFLKVLGWLKHEYGRYYGISSLNSQWRPSVFRLMETLDLYALTGEPFDLEREATQYGLSADQTARLFREALTISPYKFFNRRRIRRAQRLLGTSDKSCTEIAYELGFSDAAHFSRAFREHHDTTPLEWRKRMRMATE